MLSINAISLNTVARSLLHIQDRAESKVELSLATLENATTDYASFARFIGNLFGIASIQQKYAEIDSFKRALAIPLYEALKEVSAVTVEIGFNIGNIHVRVSEQDGGLTCEVIKPKSANIFDMDVETFSMDGSLVALRDALIR